MRIEILNNSEKKKLIKKIEKYGIENIPYLVIKSSKEKYRIFSGSFSKEEILALSRLIYIENIGLYFIKEQGTDLRISLDACHIFSNVLKHNILELDEKQAEDYLRGKEIMLGKQENLKPGFYILKYKEDILGMAKVTQDQIKNYLPKERRIKQ